METFFNETIAARLIKTGFYILTVIYSVKLVYQRLTQIVV